MGVRGVTRRILIIDDHPAVRQSLRAILESQADFLVCGEAENGQLGIEKARQLRPDAIILDISMPVLNGLEAAKILKSILPGVPIVMFTSFVHDRLSDLAAAAGANAVISKVASSDALVRTLEGLLNRSA